MKNLYANIRKLLASMRKWSANISTCWNYRFQHHNEVVSRSRIIVNKKNAVPVHVTNVLCCKNIVITFNNTLPTTHVLANSDKQGVFTFVNAKNPYFNVLCRKNPIHPLNPLQIFFFVFYPVT